MPNAVQDHFTFGHSKWGPADQLGAGNLLTAEKRLSALGTVKHGRVYDLSHEIHMGAPYMAPNQTPYLMSIWASWKDSIKRRRAMGMRNDAGTNLERVEMNMHTGTHIDALGHFPAATSCSTDSARRTW